MYWEGKNAKGGVAGKYKVELSIEDSQYQVETALQSYDKIKGDVVAFQQILGTQIVKSVLSRLKAENGYGGPASLEGVWVKQPNLMPTGTPYQVLAANGLDWYLKNGGQGKKVCAMAQDDAYGASGLDGLTQAAKTLKVKVAKTVRYATGSDTSAQVGELADANCDAVVLVSLPNDTGSIVTKMVGRNFTPQILGVAPSWLSGLENTDNGAVLPGALRLAAATARAWGDTSVPGMAQMLQDQQQYAPDQKPDTYFQSSGTRRRGRWTRSWSRPSRTVTSARRGSRRRSNQVGTLDVRRAQPATTSTASRRATATRRGRRRSRRSTVGQPIGLQVVATDYTSQRARTSSSRSDRPHRVKENDRARPPPGRARFAPR